MESIDALVKYINTFVKKEREPFEIGNKGFLVFGSTIEQHAKFKAYKTITYRVVMVRPGKGTIDVYSKSETGNFSKSGDDKRVYDTLNEDVAMFLLGLIKDRDKFNKLLIGDETIQV